MKYIIALTLLVALAFPSTSFALTNDEALARITVLQLQIKVLQLKLQMLMAEEKAVVEVKEEVTIVEDKAVDTEDNAFKCITERGRTRCGG